MKRLIMAMLSVAIVIASASASPLKLGEPRKLSLFSEARFNCLDLHEAVKYFIDLGEKRAILELIDLAWDDSDVEGFSVQERAFWVASVIYSPKDENLDRNGYYSGLPLPELPDKHLKWPNYPLFEVKGSFLVLASGASGAGGRTSIQEYLVWCQRFGNFRREIPRPKATKLDVLAFFKTQNWTKSFENFKDRERVETLILKQIPDHVEE